MPFIAPRPQHDRLHSASLARTSPAARGSTRVWPRAVHRWRHRARCAARPDGARPRPRASPAMRARGRARSLTRLAGHFVALDDERDVARIVLDDGDVRQIDVAALQGTLDDDLRRRDFTIDAMAVRVGEPAVYDPCGGLDDLQRGVIRMTAAAVLDADPLRLLRGVRLAAELHFAVDAGTMAAIRARAPRVLDAAPERRRDELCRIFALARRRAWRAPARQQRPARRAAARTRRRQGRRAAEGACVRRVRAQCPHGRRARRHARANPSDWRTGVALGRTLGHLQLARSRAPHVFFGGNERGPLARDAPAPRRSPARRREAANARAAARWPHPLFRARRRRSEDRRGDHAGDIGSR